MAIQIDGNCLVESNTIYGSYTKPEWAGGIMWAGGDLVFLIALLLAVWVWLRAEEREGVRLDAPEFWSCPSRRPR